MKTWVTFTLVGLAIVAGTASCTLMDLVKPYQGEVRLLALQMPEVSVEDLPYDVVATFDAEGQPKIKQACFRWLTERASLSTPPLYCYATEVQSNAPMGSVCSRWTTEGTYAEVSPLFCTPVEQVEYGRPGRLLVKLQTRNVQRYYHNIECYLEYVIGGETKHSNRIKTRVVVRE